MKYFSHLNSAAEILHLYKGAQPFHHFIKDFFRQHKKYGSRDRKSISRICYSYFRLGASFPAMEIQEKMLLGLFLCATGPDELLENFRPEWNAATKAPVADKCALAGIAPGQLAIFPFAEPLSPAIDKVAFVLSHLQQPDLFIRIRPGREKQVSEKLDKAGEAWQQVNDSCIALLNASKIDTVLQLDKEAVIQDYSSQRVGEFLQLAANNSAAPIRNVWDCCAASGGKSILAKDILGDIHLTVSDVRKSIIANLEKRFAAAGITQYKSLIKDLATPALSAAALAKAGPTFDLIIADAPCSGSGTWGRTPESLSFYAEEETNRYQALQKQIVSNAFPLLRKGGCFLYITCSVFEKENEAVAAFIEERFHPRLLRMESLPGYHNKADTMFAALFVNE